MASTLLIRRCAPWILVAVLALVASAQKKPDKPAPAGAQPAGETVPELGLTLSFPPEFEASSQPVKPGGQLVAAWELRCGGATCRMTLVALPLAEYRIDEPMDVSDLILHNERGEHPAFAYQEQRTLPGPFGAMPHAIFALSEVQEPGTTRTSGIKLYLCGITDKVGYVFELPIEPSPDAATLAAVRAFLAKGIVWKGKVRDPKWTKEEVQARWDADVPDAKKNKLDKVLRTDHYVILTNSSGGKLFAEKMEECYAKIKATFAFEEMPGERLMPVFLFRNPEEYHGFFAKQFETTVEVARRSKGVASRDFYATWYEAPNDPVHIHEGTHQIFGNRLRLRGGGSWFQEGVAEYMSTAPNDRNTAARTVKKGRHMPLAQFVEVESLLFSSNAESKTGEDDASSQY